MIKRSYLPVIIKDIKKKMVFLAGPRQCGKTTISTLVAQELGVPSSYYNWDTDTHRQQILQSQLQASSQLYILDELHKFPRWQNWLKGQYDEKHAEHSFLVTGSAKLDAYSRGGDSLQGRYYLHRIHPLSLSEILDLKPVYQFDFSSFDLIAEKNQQSSLESLLNYGGFPEPFLSQDQIECNRWRIAYSSRLVRDEIRDLERVWDLSRMELLYDRLKNTVGSVLSLNSLREDLEVAFETVKNWVEIFEKLYAVFRLLPYGPPKIKAVKKEQKLYFWDWSQVPASSARIENMVAMHLLRYVQQKEDVLGEKWELRYFRDKVGHEIDFILLKEGQPWCAIEVKSQEQDLDSNFKYLLQRTKIPFAFQLHFQGTKDWFYPQINDSKIRIMPMANFLAHL